jgi:hypothetical protein
MVVTVGSTLLALIAGCSGDRNSETAQNNGTGVGTKDGELAVKQAIAPVPAYAKIANTALPELSVTVDSEVVSVNSCEKFINNIQKSSAAIGETTFNMQVFAEYQTCIAAWVVDHAGTAKVSYLSEDFPGQLINDLDLSSFRSSLGPRLKEGKQTLSAFSFASIETSDGKVSIKDDGWTYEFTRIARGDFNNNGVEDFLVRFLDQSQEGSYFSVRTLVVERYAEDQSLLAQDAISLIKQQ